MCLFFFPGLAVKARFFGFGLPLMYDNRFVSFTCRCAFFFAFRLCRRWVNSLLFPSSGFFFLLLSALLLFSSASTSGSRPREKHVCFPSSPLRPHPPFLSPSRSVPAPRHLHPFFGSFLFPAVTGFLFDLPEAFQSELPKIHPRDKSGRPSFSKVLFFPVGLSFLSFFFE